MLYPCRCPLCEGIVENRGELCDSCAYLPNYIVSPFCLKCGKQLEIEELDVCTDCKRNNHAFERGVAAFCYTGEIKKSIYRFKYHNRREYASFYANSLYRLRGHIIRSWEPDVLVPVPLHAKRKRKRGYNQAELIASELGKLMEIKVDFDILARKVNTKPQKELNDKERINNLKSAFQVTKNSVQYKHIVLIDDIYTTGATLNACSRELRDAGAEAVFHACVCVGNGY